MVWWNRDMETIILKMQCFQKMNNKLVGLDGVANMYHFSMLYAKIRTQLFLVWLGERFVAFPLPWHFSYSIQEYPTAIALFYLLCSCLLIDKRTNAEFIFSFLLRGGRGLGTWYSSVGEKLRFLSYEQRNRVEETSPNCVI